MENINIVSISFHSAGKIFDFDSGNLELEVGDRVIVETERGRALGTVVRELRKISPDEAPPKLKSVLRKAQDADLEMAESNAQREDEALKFCRQRVQERNMDMKLVRAEYLFDGSKIIFYFTADGRIDFRELVRDLAQHFRTRIEMRQIGVRDEAKLVGGIGVCGRELCCCTHLRNFAPVSVKMAKAQGLALNPSKISGQCSRLLCCLAYEYETYNELRKNLPKCGKKIPLESGPAEVLAVDVLAQKMTLCCADGERCTVHVDDLKKGLDKRPADKRTGAKPAEPASESRGSEQKSEKAEKPERRNRRSGNRNRRQKPPQQAAEQDEKQQADRPAKEQDKDPGKPKRRRNRRRPRKKTGGQQPENKS